MTSEALEASEAQRLTRTGVAILAIGIPVLLGCALIILLDRSHHEDWIAHPTPLIVRHTGVGALYVGVLIVVAGIICGANYIYSGWQRRRSGSTKRLHKFAAVLVAIGFAGIFIGRPVDNAYWAHALSTAGYTHCAGRGFALTGQLFREVWVRQPTACTDERFATMMRDPRFSREEITTYVASLGARDLK